jgi:hypothetical protein
MCAQTENHLYSCLFVLCRGCSRIFLRNRLCSLAISKGIWHSFCEMCIASNRPPELTALVEALTLRRGVFQLKGRLLKAVRSELQAAKGSGLTWRIIWGTLREEGYPGGYQQFCKAANLAIEGTQARISRKAKNLPPPAVGKEIYQPKVRESGLSTESTEDKEKPAWQVQREEAMAKLDREAELNRQREARLKPTKVFKPSVFVGRSEN